MCRSASRLYLGRASTSLAIPILSWFKRLKHQTGWIVQSPRKGAKWGSMSLHFQRRAFPVGFAPAWTKYVMLDPETKMINGVSWEPYGERHKLKNLRPVHPKV